MPNSTKPTSVSTANVFPRAFRGPSFDRLHTFSDQVSRSGSRLKSIAHAASHSTWRKSAERFVKFTVFSMILGATAGYVFGMYADVPEVHRSHLNGECVAVYAPEGMPKYDCRNLPKRFLTVWVF